MPSKDNPIVSSHRDAATRISTYLRDSQGIRLKPIVALEVLARALGANNWQTLKALADQGRAPRSASLFFDPATMSTEVPTATVTGRMADTSFAADRREKLVRNLKYRSEAGKFDNGGDFGRALDRVQDEMQVLLSPTQRAAVHEAVTARVSIISGYPDSGKAVIAEAIVRTAALLDVRNPINARRGEPVTLDGKSFEAPEFRTVDVVGLFKQSSRMRLREMLDDCELFIIDQHVTADPGLFWEVVQATPSDCHLVILGDIKRHDGSEMGAMFDELIEGGHLNFVQLHEALGRQQARIDEQVADASRTVTPSRQQPGNRSAGVQVLDLLDDEPSPPVVEYDGTAEEVARLLLERAVTLPLPMPEGRDQRMAQVQQGMGPDYTGVSRGDIHELLAQPVSLLVQKGLATNKRLRVLIRTLTLERMRLFTNMNMEANEFERRLRRLNYAEPSLGDLDVLLLTTRALENYSSLAPLLRVLSPKCRVLLVVNPEFTAGSPEAQQIIDALKGSANVRCLSYGAEYALEDPIEYSANRVPQHGVIAGPGTDESSLQPIQGTERAPQREQTGARPWLPGKRRARHVPSKTPGRGFVNFAPSFSSTHMSGKWCIFRNEETVDDAWAIVENAIDDKRLVGALVSCKGNAKEHGGSYVICVFTRNYYDLADVMQARETLRALGFTEELKYKRDIDTFNNVYGVPEEWYYSA